MSRTKSSKAVLETAQSLVFPTKLMSSILGQSNSRPVSFCKVWSVNVIAEEFEIAAADPLLRPKAPRESVLSLVRDETIFNTSTLETPVEVKESFSRDVQLERCDTWRTAVNDRSKRCKFGQMASIALIEGSERNVCLSLSVFNFGSRNSGSSGVCSAVNSFPKVASVCEV